MPRLFQFNSELFDVAAETPNHINPIPGESLLRWLKPRLESAGFEMTSPAPEDWGWYVELRDGAQRYLLGASGEADDQEPLQVDWTLQAHQRRSLLDRLRRRNRPTPGDPLLRTLEDIVCGEPAFHEVSVYDEA